MNSPNYPCPSCGFIVFDEPIGSYDICPLCGWEDDPVQLATPGLRGGANGGSLLDNQINILNDLPPEISEWRGYKRATDWRPLFPSECSVENPSNGSGVNYFHAACKENPPYYWRADA
ncbi:CPCC family cysteine-rich protein [Geothrix sp. PMB-07]|uniref:CPCC family cysteine-rich protein n=1 Tax=Geothrix sp. PMB-07 TaxID=3068640 RepID=UPI0035577DD9